jgi:site-specific DNA-cytosine methylase
VTLLSLFSGIAGLERGLEPHGFRVVGQCERDPFARRILARHYGDVPCVSDVREIDAGWKVGAVCGGFPCQPHSQAGARKASQDERDLWPETRRVVSVVRPRVFVGENVPGLLTSEGGHFFWRILQDLDALGYAVTWDHVPAVAVGAPHIRDRVFIVATLAEAPEADEAPWGLIPGATQRWPRAGRFAGGRAWARSPRFRVPGWAVSRSPKWGKQAGPPLLFPTPRASSANGVGEHGEGAPDLQTIVRTYPTPTAKDAANARSLTANRGHVGPNTSIGVTLCDFVTMFPTPSAHDGEAGGRQPDGRRGMQLRDLAGGNARLWPTPRAEERNQYNSRDAGVALSCAVEPNATDGALSPSFVEWLMGFPLGWTEPEGPSLRDAAPAPWTHEPCPRLTTGRKHRPARLRCLGNAVVPNAAAAATGALLLTARRGAA